MSFYSTNNIRVIFLCILKIYEGYNNNTDNTKDNDIYIFLT